MYGFGSPVPLVTDALSFPDQVTLCARLNALFAEDKLVTTEPYLMELYYGGWRAEYDPSNYTEHCRGTPRRQVHSQELREVAPPLFGTTAPSMSWTFVLLAVKTAEQTSAYTAAGSPVTYGCSFNGEDSVGEPLHQAFEEARRCVTQAAAGRCQFEEWLGGCVY